MDLQGQVAFITGAASGIGRASARRLAREGARLYLTDIDGAGLDRIVAELSAGGAEVAGEVLDVARASACRDAVARAVARFSRLDVLCNIAGVLKTGHLADITAMDWQRLVDVNLSGVFYLCQAAMPHLERSGGNIINMASSAGLVGQAYNAAYCATKGGVVMMTKALAMEFAGRGVRVNALCPGAIKTPMARAFSKPAGGDASLLKRMAPPTGQPGEPEQVAAAVAFLAGPSARYITGAALPVDGGQVAG